MKIAQIGSFPLDAACIKGGVEASVYGLVLEQAKNHIVSVLDIPRPEIEVDQKVLVENIQVFRFSSKGNSNYSGLLRVKTILKIIKDLDPDICHIHTTSLFSFVIYLLLKINGLKTIVTIHGLAHIEKQNTWRGKKNLKNILKLVVQSFTEFVFLTFCPICIVDTRYVESAIMKYRKQWKIFHIPICKVIPQGIDSVFFNVVGTESINKKLFSVGSLSKRKGHLALIQAMIKVRTVYPDFSLSIAGILAENNYFELMQKSIQVSGLQENIHIYPNATFKQILKLYSESEIFVLHSQEESQGIVFCEAMAAGKSIVATNVGGIPWVVENNVNGLLSDYGDSDTFADNIIKLMNDNKLRKEIEKNNRNVSHKYDWQIISDQIMEVYNLVI